MANLVITIGRENGSGGRQLGSEPAAAQNTPRIAASAFLPSGCKIIMHLDNFRS